MKKSISLLTALALIISLTMAVSASGIVDPAKATANNETLALQSESQEVAIYTPNEPGVPMIMPRGSWSVNWSLPYNTPKQGTNQFSLEKGSTIKIDFKWTPASNVSIGVYEHNTNTYFWLATSSKGSETGTITITSTGLYSLAAKNNTSGTTTTITGSYTV